MSLDCVKNLKNPNGFDSKLVLESNPENSFNCANWTPVLLQVEYLFVIAMLNSQYDRQLVSSGKQAVATAVQHF